MNLQNAEPKKKTIFVKVFGEKGMMPFRVEISETSTVGKILSELGLDGYLMFNISTRIILFSREPLFFRVNNGEFLGVVRDQDPFMEDE